MSKDSSLRGRQVSYRRWTVSTYPDEIGLAQAGRPGRLPRISKHPRLRGFLGYLKGIWGIFLSLAVVFLIIYKGFSEMGVPPLFLDAAFCVVIGLSLWWLVHSYFREEEPEEEPAPRPRSLTWDQDVEAELEDEEFALDLPLPPERPEGDARSMVQPTIEAALPPEMPATVVIGPRIWAAYAWLFFIAMAALTAYVAPSMPGNRHLAEQVAILGALDLLAGATVLIWTLRRRLVADATGIRELVAGKARNVLPWDRVKLITYGVCRREVLKRTYRAGGFIEIKDRRRWRSVYADSIFYSVDTKKLARFTQYLVQEAARKGVRARYADQHWSSDDL